MAEHVVPAGRQVTRDILPIPDRPVPAVRTFDAKDPETSFPRIEPLRPPGGAPNVLVCMLDDVGFGASSAFGGWCLYATGGRAKYCYNFFGIHLYMVEAALPLPAGTHEVRVEFAYDGGPGKGGR